VVWLRSARPFIRYGRVLREEINAEALVCCGVIIFHLDTPHFWALAIHREKDYARRTSTMLPGYSGMNLLKLRYYCYTDHFV